MLKTSIFLIIGLPILYLIGVLVYASATKFCPIDRAHLEKLNQRPISKLIKLDTTLPVI